jgi:murein L,D-transpeptidase YafK
MTDPQISEVYGLARDAFAGGQPAFQIQAYPFRMTPENLARHRTNPNLPFWQMLKIGNDHFEATHLQPKVDVCDRRYVFDARPVPGSAVALTFDPAQTCPAFVVDPKIAEPSFAKQSADDARFAQLVKEDVPVAPIHSGIDGGMNAAFHPAWPFNFISLANVLLDGTTDLPPLRPVPYLAGYRVIARAMLGP